MKPFYPLLFLLSFLTISPIAKAAVEHKGDKYAIIYFDSEPTPEMLDSLKKKGCSVLKSETEKNVVYVRSENCDSCFQINPNGAKRVIYVEQETETEYQGSGLQQNYNSPNLLELFFNFIQ